MSSTKHFRHIILLDLPPGPHGNLCPHSPNKRNECRNGMSFPPRPRSQQGAEPGFEPKASLTLAPGRPAVPAEPRMETPRASSPTARGRVPAGQRPRPGRSWGSPAGSLGKQRASAHGCVVTARLILHHHAACVGGGTWDCLFSLGVHV